MLHGFMALPFLVFGRLQHAAFYLQVQYFRFLPQHFGRGDSLGALSGVGPLWLLNKFTVVGTTCLRRERHVAPSSVSNSSKRHFQQWVRCVRLRFCRCLHVNT